MAGPALLKSHSPQHPQVYEESMAGRGHSRCPFPLCHYSQFNLNIWPSFSSPCPPPWPPGPAYPSGTWAWYVPASLLPQWSWVCCVAGRPHDTKLGLFLYFCKVPFKHPQAELNNCLHQPAAPQPLGKAARPLCAFMCPGFTSRCGWHAHGYCDYAPWPLCGQWLS